MRPNPAIRSIGVLHPTFEVWGGAEWFIHQILQTLVGELSIDAVLYTHRFETPQGEKPAYRVVCHRRGGVISAPWDWERIARELGESWRAHDLLFVHNHPSALWYRHARAAMSLPPAVWYCHEPPATLYGADPREDPPKRRSWSRTRLLESLAFYRGRSTWRIASGARRRSAQWRRGGSAWLEEMRRRDRDAVSCLSVIVANSLYTAGKVEAIYSRKARVIHPLPPDLESFKPPPGTEKDPIILWVGRMETAKRPLLLLEAWEAACRSEPRLRDYKLVLIGDGPLRARVLERIEGTPFSGSIECRRGLRREEMIVQYQRALLTVHLGLEEPFGLVPIESMAAGTPVLAECQGGVRETVIDGRTGWCIEGIDALKLAERLARIPTTHAELAALGKNASDHVQSRFGFRRSFQDLLECLENAATSLHPLSPTCPESSLRSNL